MALRLAELEPDRTRVFFCTPTGDELPPMTDHWATLERLLGQPIVRVSNGTLASQVFRQNMIPNHRARWWTPRILSARSAAMGTPGGVRRRRPTTWKEP